MHFDRLLEIFGLILISIFVSFLICLFFSISFLWMLSIIPIDALIIWCSVRGWAKEDAEAEKEELAFWKELEEQD